MTTISKDLPKETILTTITSTRVRLARNIADYPFPEKLNKAQAEEIIRAVRYELTRMDEFTQYDMSEMSEADAEFHQSYQGNLGQYQW